MGRLKTRRHIWGYSVANTHRRDTRLIRVNRKVDQKIGINNGIYKFLRELSPISWEQKDTRLIRVNRKVDQKIGINNGIYKFLREPSPISWEQKENINRTMDDKSLMSYGPLKIVSARYIMS